MPNLAFRDLRLRRLGSMGAGVTVGVDPAIGIVTANGGALFVLDEGQVFQDRSVTPSTVANVGDPVGTWVDQTGEWFAIATNDAARMTLRQTSDGRYYLEGARNTNRYNVQNAGAVALEPASGAEFTAFFAGWGLATNQFQPFAWGTDGFRNAFIGNTAGATNVPSVYNTSNSAIDLGWYFPGNQNSIFTLRHKNNPTLRVEGANESPTIETGNVKTDTVTGGFAIGTRDNDAQSEGALRHYLYCFVPAILSDEDCETIEAYLAPFVRQPSTPISADLVDLNFAASSYLWGGASRVLGDLTDNLDGSYSLDYGDWAAAGYLISIDFMVPDWSLNLAGQRIMRVDRDNMATVANREGFFYRDASDNIHYKYPDIADGINAGFRSFGIGAGTGDVQEGLQRATLWVRPGEKARFQLNGYIWEESEFRNLWQKTPDGLTVWEDFTSGNVMRLRAKGGTFDQAAADEFHQASDVGLPVHVIGDSFVVFGVGSGVALQQAIVNDGYVNITFDGVGGATMAQHAGRMADYPSTRQDNVYASTLVINDGGWSPSETTTAASINSMIALLEGHSRWIYVQPWPDDSIPIGNATRTSWDAAQATLASTFGSNYIPSFNAVLCAHGDAAQDITDVGNGLIPDSLTDDGVHPNATSYAILARVIRGALARLGHWSITTTAPGAPTSFTESSLALSWSLPADDGGDPVRSFTVSVETSPGSGTFTDVYTGQLRRHTLTGLTTGTWAVRVRATNETGTGPNATISVVVP